MSSPIFWSLFHPVTPTPVVCCILMHTNIMCSFTNKAPPDSFPPLDPAGGLLSPDPQSSFMPPNNPVRLTPLSAPSWIFEIAKIYWLLGCKWYSLDGLNLVGFGHAYDCSAGCRAIRNAPRVLIAPCQAGICCSPVDAPKQRVGGWRISGTAISPGAVVFHVSQWLRQQTLAWA